jgi:hypothetical protein
MNQQANERDLREYAAAAEFLAESDWRQNKWMPRFIEISGNAIVPLCLCLMIESSHD